MNHLIYIILSTLLMKNGDGIRIDETLMSQSPFYGITVASEKLSDGVCKDELLKISDGIYDRKKWALKLLDASGVPSSGLLWGAVYWAGDRMQCEASTTLKYIPISPALGPVTVETIEDVVPFPVSFYAAFFQHNSSFQYITHFKNEFTVNLGLCLPKSCNEADLSEVLQQYFDSNVFHYQNMFNTSFQMMNMKKIIFEEPPLAFSDILFRIFLLALASIYIIATIGDIKYRRSKQMAEKKDDKDKIVQSTTKTDDNKPELPFSHKILRHFSLYTNSDYIFNNHNPNNIGCVHGLKSIMYPFVILNHAVYFNNDNMENRLFIYRGFDSNGSFLIMLISQSVDVFFTISAFLTGLSFFKKEMEKPTKTFKIKEKFGTYIDSISKRYLRLTPSYMVGMMLTMWMSDRLYKITPFWVNQRNDLICAESWWHNLLYVHNLIPHDRMCMDWCWFLSVDMQLHAITFFLLILSSKYLYTAMTISFAFMAYFLYFAYDIVYSSLLSSYIDELQNKMSLYYFCTTGRIPLFFFGIYGAYIYLRYKKDFVTGKINPKLLWSTVIISLISIIIFQYCAIRNVHIILNFLYAAASKILFGIITVCILIACETGHGGNFNWFLSLKIWFPLSQVSYAAQMINPIVIFYLQSVKEKPFHLQYSTNIATGLGIWFYVVAASYLFTILIIFPSMGVVNEILIHFTKPRKPKVTKTE